MVATSQEEYADLFRDEGSIFYLWRCLFRITEIVFDMTRFYKKLIKKDCTATGEQFELKCVF